MNDCVWCFIWKCDGENCKCNKYISANSSKGHQIINEYEQKKNMSKAIKKNKTEEE